MPAEYLTSWRPSAIIAAHTELVALLDADALPAKMTAHDAADTLLATVTLGDPCGSVDGTTGQLTLNIAVREEAAPAGGDVSYWTIRDGAGLAYRSLPAEVGTTPVAGKVVMNTLAVVAGGPVEVLSATVG